MIRPAWIVALATATVGLEGGCAKGGPLDLDPQPNDGGSASEGGAPPNDPQGGSGASGDGGASEEGGAAEGGGGASSGGCGDGIIGPGETCDDANATAGDGCDACEIECAADSIQDSTSGHCYRLFVGAESQPTAEANCQAWGGAPGLGHLASMGDQAENDLVAALVASNTWIGADDFGGSFAWIDGTPFSFVSWQVGEPNHPGTEHCMFMDAEAKWHDHDCGDLRPAYLCERSGAGAL